MKHYLPALLAIFLLSGCQAITNSGRTKSRVPTKVEPVKVEQKSSYIFNAVGYAPIDAQSGANFDIKMLHAIKASKLEAYKEMAEQIHGVLLNADNSVEGATLSDDKIKSQVKGLVRGARVLRSYHKAGLYITELELDMKTLPILKELQTEGKTRNVPRAVYY